MAKLKISRQTTATADEAFSVLTDIEAFPSFVTGVKTMRKENVRATPTGEQFEARGILKTTKLGGTVVAAVTVDRARRSIRVSPKLGPFKLLNALCVVNEKPAGAEVSCSLEIEFAPPMLRSLLETRLSGVAAGYADLFAARASSMRLAQAA